MLKIENLYKSYGKLLVLKDINLDVNKGDIVVIIGSSGSGKSTLLRCINYLNKPDKGKIYFNNILLNDNNINIYRQKIGMVFQNFNLFNNLNVLDNIILAPVKLGLLKENEAINKAKEYLEKFDLIDKINTYPVNLSGGQKQRIAIIRTLLMDPDIILFDEPTSALDPEMVKEVQEMMLDLVNNGMTMIIVTHDVSFIKEVATKIVFMDEGKILHIGTYQELIKSKDDKIKTFLSKID